MLATAVTSFVFRFFSCCFLFVFRITGFRFFLYSILFKVAVDSLVVQRLRNNKTIMAKRRRVTTDELLSILQNIPDNVSDYEDSGAEIDDIYTPHLVSDSSSSDESEQNFRRSFNSGLGVRDHPPKSFKINLKESASQEWMILILQ